MLYLLLLALPAQPPDKAQVQTTVFLYSLAYLGDKGLQADLKMTEEQCKKFEPRVGQFVLDVGNSRRNAKAREELVKSHTKYVEGVLDAGQCKRLRQIALQHMARVPSAGPVLAEDAVAKELKLDEAQLAKLRNKAALAGLLTPEQTKAWAVLVGKPYPARLIITARGPYVRLPNLLNSLLSDAVEHELKLTDRQKAELDEVAGRYNDLFPMVSVFDSRPHEADALKAARAVLTPEQRKRYNQLALRQSTAFYGEDYAFRTPQLAAALKVTPEQAARAAKLVAAQHAKLIELYTSDVPLADVRARSARSKAELKKALADELTGAQRKALDEALGAPPPAYLSLTPFLPPYPREKDVPPRTFLAALALAFTSYPGAREFVGWDKAQGDKIAALRKRFPFAPPAPGEEAEKKRKADADAIDKEMAAVFTPKKWAGMKGLALRNSSRSDLFSAPAVVTLAEFQDRLKVTKAQSLRFARGAPISAVLTPAQLAEWAKMREENPLSPAAPAAAPAAATSATTWSRIMYIADPGVRAELKLSDDQKKALDEKAAEFRKSYPKRPTGSVTDWAAAREKWAADADAAITRVLDAKQNRRLRQIAYWKQLNPLQGATNLLRYPDVRAELKLDDKQSALVEQLQQELWERQQLLALVRSPGAGPTQKYNEAVVKLIDGKLRKALGAEKSKAVDDLLGPEFKGGYPRPGPGTFFP